MASQLQRSSKRKAAKLRTAARQKALAAQPAALQLRETQRHESREIVLSAETRAMVEEMVAEGFCAPNTMPTVKQFSRYAAYRNSRAAANRAAAVENEVAIFNANGGVMDMIFQRLRNPKLKDTAFAHLVNAAQKGVVMATSLVDETQRVTIATDSHVIDEDELDKIAAELSAFSLPGSEGGDA